jgi:hypothetical protein
MVNSVETCVDVFGCAYFGSSSGVDKGRSPVSRVGSNTDGTSPLVSVDLDVSVEEFLDGSSTTFDPRLFVGSSEVLRSLDDSDVRIRFHSWDEFCEVIMARAEIGIVDDEEVTTGAGEGPSEITSFLETSSIVTADIIETVLRCQDSDFGLASIIENPNFHFPFRIFQLLNVLVGVLENGKWLFTARKVNINGWRMFRCNSMIPDPF